MSITEEFFEEVFAQAKRESEAAVVAATDPLHLKASGISGESIQRFIDGIRSISRSPEFQLYLESVVLSAYVGLFVSIDGLSATFDKKVMLSSLDGEDLGEDLHEDFIRFLLDKGVDW